MKAFAQRYPQFCQEKEELDYYIFFYSMSLCPRKLRQVLGLPTTMTDTFVCLQVPLPVTWCPLTLQLEFQKDKHILKLCNFLLLKLLLCTLFV